MPRIITRHLAAIATAATVFATPATLAQATDTSVAVETEIPAPIVSAPKPAPRDSRPLGPSQATGSLEEGVRMAPVAGPNVVRTVASLGAVLGVIFAGAAIFKKFAGRNQSLAGSLGAAGKSPAGILEIIGRYPLNRGNTLVLLRLDNRVLLLSQSISASGRGLIRPGAVSLNTLCEVTGAADVASILAKARDAEGESINARFQSILSDYSAGDEPIVPDPEKEAVAPLNGAAAEAPAVVVRTGSWSSTRNASVGVVGGVGGMEGVA